MDAKALALTAVALLLLTGFASVPLDTLAVEAQRAEEALASGSAHGGNPTTATPGDGGEDSSFPLLLAWEFTAEGRADPQGGLRDPLRVGDTVVFERDQAGHTTKYVYAARLRIARVDRAPAPPPQNLACATSYYLTDHLGSTRKVLSGSWPLSVTFTAEYTPFGEPYAVEGTEGFRFTGEAHDAATGFTHLRARQYDPGTGRFTGADAVLGSLSAPQTQNRYAYAVGNPERYTDPSGTCIWDFCIVEGLIVLAILGIILAAVSHDAPPEVRLITDGAATAIGFIPLFGDVFSTAYFLTHDFLDCAEGHCDGVAIGLDAIGIVPGIPSLGSAGFHLGKVALNVVTGAPLLARYGARVGDDVVDVGRMGWHLGDPVNSLTHAGDYPSWGTVHRRYWMNEAHLNPRRWSPDDLALMRRGNAPIRDGSPMHLHHLNGRNIPDPHNPSNLRPVTWLEHIEIHRHVR